RRNVVSLDERAEVELLHSHDGPLWPEIERRLTALEVQRVTILAPFFDRDLAFLKRIRERWLDAEIVVAQVGYMPDTCCVVLAKVRVEEPIQEFSLLGVLLAFAWQAGLAACATWLLVAGLLRYSSLAALLSLAAAPLYIWLFTRDLQLVELIAVLAAMVWIRHRVNIVRLLKGEEPRIGGKQA
ncbi:MAG: glycerol-3-phosphate acyltransferase, partial [Proteobacteria bacterium]|nr:glycerol-3-phosphate acyltransferase [Pseudomonadota bacterium]